MKLHKLKHGSSKLLTKKKAYQILPNYILYLEQVISLS